AGSPYAITGSNAQGTGLANYTISYVDGALTIDPASLVITPDSQIAFGESIRRFGNGSMPLTPGDASFRTTQAHAPPAISSPFALTYSLGKVVRLTPKSPTDIEDGSTSDRGLVATDASDGSAGVVCLGGFAQPDCAGQAVPESFWSTWGEAMQ
ncbi:MAG: hypothetical protein P8Z78_07500, partial [Gammaproteobacteria bacterium]